VVETGDDLTAFEYLTSGRVDVAFVNLKIIEKKTEMGKLRKFLLHYGLLLLFALLHSHISNVFC